MASTESLCLGAPSRRRARRGTMRILIVDDHTLVRRGMAYVVEEGFPDADIVEADGTASALEMMRNGAADIALVDVRMPDLDGLELLRAIKAEWPDVPVIMLSTYDNAPYVRRALADGAAGYMLKDATPKDLSRRSPSRSPAVGTCCRRESSRTSSTTSSPPDRALTGAAAASNRVQLDAAGARNPIATLGGPEQPLYRAEPVPIREDREGPPGRHVPQARRHEPDPSRDDGREMGVGAAQGGVPGTGEE